MPPLVPLTSLTRAAKPILGVGVPTTRRLGGSLYRLPASAWHQSPERRVKDSGGLPPPGAGVPRLSCCGPAWDESGGRGLEGKMRGGAPRVLARAHPSKAQLRKPACPGAPLCPGRLRRAREGAAILQTLLGAAAGPPALPGTPRS